MKIKRLLFILGLLFSVSGKAQVDSFAFKGRSLQFEVPRDWVIEEKSNEIQEQDAFNLILRYGVDTKSLNARIFITFINNDSLKARSGKDNKKKVFVSRTITIANRTGIESTWSQNRGKEQTTEIFFESQLNYGLELVCGFFCTSPKSGTDTLKITFERFVLAFLEDNQEPINSLTPQFIPGRASLQLDSFNYFQHYYKFYFPNDFHCNIRQQNSNLLKSFTGVKFSISRVQLEKSAETSTLHSDINITFEIVDDSLVPRKAQHDSIGNYDLLCIENSSPIYGNYSKEYYIKLQAPILSRRTVCFRLYGQAQSQVEYLFYQEMTRKFIQAFIEVNHLTQVKK